MDNGVKIVNYQKGIFGTIVKHINNEESRIQAVSDSMPKGHGCDTVPNVHAKLRIK
jgi:hypothetical protein